MGLMKREMDRLDTVRQELMDIAERQGAISPDLNPIEKFFAKLKHWLRNAARRTVDAVCNAVAEILPLTSPAECSNYFAQAGYTQPKTITLWR